MCVCVCVCGVDSDDRGLNIAGVDAGHISVHQRDFYIKVASPTLFNIMPFISVHLGPACAFIACSDKLLKHADRDPHRGRVSECGNRPTVGRLQGVPRVFNHRTSCLSLRRRMAQLFLFFNTHKEHICWKPVVSKTLRRARVRVCVPTCRCVCL